MQAYLLVGIGGALGAMARYGIGGAIGALPNGFPISTFFINVMGSVAMGVLIGILAKTVPQFSMEIRLFVAVGVLGGFTTFSSFSLDAMAMLERGDVFLALAYVVGSVALSLLGFWLGMVAIRVIA